MYCIDKSRSFICISHTYLKKILFYRARTNAWFYASIISLFRNGNFWVFQYFYSIRISFGVCESRMQFAILTSIHECLKFEMSDVISNLFTAIFEWFQLFCKIYIHIRTGSTTHTCLIVFHSSESNLILPRAK